MSIISIRIIAPRLPHSVSCKTQSLQIKLSAGRSGTEQLQGRQLSYLFLKAWRWLLQSFVKAYAINALFYLISGQPKPVAEGCRAIPS